MSGQRVDFGRLFGITLGFDLSWLIIAALVAWSLAIGVFPESRPELAPDVAWITPAVAWIMGAAGSIGLFTSVLFHEMAHALTARQFGVGTRRITLFIFGGVAELEDEPPTPTAEFVIALAGPAASLLAAAGCMVLAPFALALTSSVPASVTIVWIGWMNLILAIFNLLPAFPLDGGRVLRAILWWWRKDHLGATRISSLVGQGFAFAFIGWGVLQILSTGNIAAGLWPCLIGMFIRSAARSQYQQVAWRQLLEGEPVSHFMRTDPVVVPRHISIGELMNSYVRAHRLPTFPVVDDERILGLVNAQAAARTPQQDWERQSVGTVTEPCSASNTVGPQTDALDALGRMRRNGLGRLLVVDGSHLVGTLTLADLGRGLAGRAT